MKINFGSTKLAFVLISLLIVLVIISAIIPQKDISTDQITDIKEYFGDNYKIIETLRLDDIYKAPYFFILVGLLIINIIFGNIKRFRIIRKSEKTLIKTRHIGSLIFHFSLILIMVGVILNYLFKFEGVMFLTEGQTLNDNNEQYFRIYAGPLYREQSNRFQLKLHKYHGQYPFLSSFTNAAEIDVAYQSGSYNTASIVHNAHPFKWNNLEFHYGSNSGYSPLVVLTDTTDYILFQAFVRLSHDRESKKHFDYLILDNLKLKLEIEAIPDSGQFDSTFFKIRVAKDSLLLYDDTVKINTMKQFGNYKIIIPETRRWCYIEVIESPYIDLVFWAFWTALSGLLIGFLPRVIGEIRKQ